MNNDIRLDANGFTVMPLTNSQPGRLAGSSKPHVRWTNRIPSHATVTGRLQIRAAVLKYRQLTEGMASSERVRHLADLCREYGEQSVHHEIDLQLGVA